jgi:O-antigen/teichoic acid export membrane protein
MFQGKQRPAAPVLLPVLRMAQFIQGYWTPSGRAAAIGLLALGVCQFVSLSSQLASMVTLSHALGADGYGRYLYCLAFLPYFLFATSYGTATVALRSLRRESRETAVVVSTALTGGLVVTAPLSLGLLTLAFFSSLTTDQKAYLVSVAVGGMWASLFIGYVFDAGHRQWVGAIPISIVDLAIGVTFWFASPERVTPMFVAVVTMLRFPAMAGIQWLILLFGEHTPLKRPSFADVASILRESVGPAVYAALAHLGTNLSLVLVWWLHGDRQTACLGTAFQVNTVYQAATDIAIQILAPHIHSAYGTTRSFVLKLSLFMAVFQPLVAAAVFVVGHAYISRALPVDLADSLPHLKWVVMASFARSAWEVSAIYLLRAGTTKWSVAIRAFALSASGVLAVALNSRLGPTAFTIASFFATTFAAIWQCHLAYRAYRTTSDT